MEIYSCRDPEDQVYRPSDDSYLLLKTLLESKNLYGSRVILDLGAGSGYIAQNLCLELIERGSATEIIAIDISPCSMRYIKTNMPKECVDRIYLIQCDGASCLRKGSVDLVAINPPYLPVNERSSWIEISWSGGERGVEAAIEMVGSALEPLSREGSIYVLLSSLGDLGFFEESIRAMGLGYKVKARKRLFFEELLIYVLSKAGEAFNEKGF